MKKSLPAGNDFLPDIDMDHLKKLYKKEKDPKAKERLLAFMARKRGDSLRTIGKNFCKSFSVIRVWLYRVIDGGLDNIYDIKRPGPARRLTEEQLAALKADLIAGPQKHGFESSMWTGKLVAEHVRRKYNVEFVPRTMQDLLREMGFRHIKPRPRHPKAASEEEKAEFKKKLKKW